MGFFSRKAQAASSSRSPSRACRPHLEILEDRRLLSAGALDPTFGSGGVVMNDLSPLRDGAIDVVFQANGKTVVGGYTTNSKGTQDSVVRRYNADGSLDTSFGANGMTVTDFKAGWNESGLSLAVQPDGKIIGAASSYNPQDWTFPYDARWGLARYTANGALDKSFGTHGKVVTDLGNGTDTISGVALQADGKIVVSGNTNGFTGGDNFFVARYNANGSVDTSFGSGKGYVITDIGGSDHSGELAIQSDGKIIVVGSASYGSLAPTPQFVVARYNSNGSLDVTFGSGGVVLTPFSDANGPVEGLATDVMLQADGRIVVAGTNFVTRYMPLDGSLDPSFGSGGIVFVGSAGRSLAAQADGKLVLGGFENFYEDLGAGDAGMSSRFLLTRISGVDGGVDPSFGDSGWVRTYLTQPDRRGYNVLSAIALQADGKIVGAANTGLWETGGIVNTKFTLVRYLGDTPLPLQAAAAAPKPNADLLTDSQVQPLLREALARWQAIGADLSRLGQLDIRIADLGGTMLGLASGNTIWLDTNAAGWGWFVDWTPRDDSEFTTPGNQGEMNRMDLLTVLVHEIGHLLGHPHEDAGVMTDTLAAGIRNVPDSSAASDWSALVDALFAGPLSGRRR